MATKKKSSVWKSTSLPQVYRHRNRRYYVRTYAGGKEKWASLETTLLSVAKHRVKEHLEAADKLRASGQKAASGPLSFGDAVEIFRKQLEGSDVRPNTKAFHEAGIKLVQRSWEGIANTNVRRISARDVESWLRNFVANAKPYIPVRAKRAARNSTGASLTTIKCALGSMRMILDVAVESGHLPTNPARHDLVAARMGKIAKRIKKVKSVRGDTLHIPTSENFTKLVNTVRNAGVSDCRASADYIEFIAYCGARKNEANNVQWRDIDFAKGLIHLRVTKNGDERVVRMIPEMRLLLERLVRERNSSEPSDPVLLVKEAQGFITSACKKIGIPRFTTHALRHLFGTSCLEAGVDVRTIAEWLGHKDKGALLLKVYSHVRPHHETEMAKKVRIGTAPSGNQEGDRATP
jgi:integrase